MRIFGNMLLRRKLMKLFNLSYGQFDGSYQEECARFLDCFTTLDLAQGLDSSYLVGIYRTRRTNSRKSPREHHRVLVVFDTASRHALIVDYGRYCTHERFCGYLDRNLAIFQAKSNFSELPTHEEVANNPDIFRELFSDRTGIEIYQLCPLPVDLTIFRDDMGVVVDRFNEFMSAMRKIRNATKVK